ncbi:MAG: LysR family transcriptional regulator [Parvibaculum sp.]|uniref:LysR family transcriptional regulator n=1 Tax=Parvibaculum sp. TaxID=2024848 RepID=UPI0025D0395D|nr:LysR substrate-binding domain-containing protein [Parvibaculum sp.]MCE9650418.1 LysR family transcriptional regulator [Parvibaculum sp.]
MNIRQLDLNLLLVFDAIYREQSISAAARKLNLSQPAVSNALARLRNFTDDQLFFRSGNAMVPTRAANALAVPIRHALTAVESGLSALRNFDPATSDRTFRLGVNDSFRFMLVPALANALEREAPNVKFEFRAEARDAPALVEALHRGDIDLSLLPAPAVQTHEGLSFEPINLEKLVLVARTGHPAQSKPVTMEVLSNLRYVTTSNAPAAHALVEAVFKAQKIERSIAFVVPDTATIPAIVEMTNFVGVVGSSFLARYQRDHAIAPLNAPFEFPPISVGLVWAQAADDDQGHKWMRDKTAQILKAALSVGEPHGASAS